MAQASKAEDSDIRTALIDSWAVTALGPELIEQALTITAGWNHDEIREPVCAMLSNGGDPGHPTAWHQIEQAQHLAAGLWPTSDDATSGAAGIMMEVANRPAGHLARFWTKVAQWVWSDNESSCDGIPAGVGEQLDRLVSATDRNGLLARSFLASRLGFLFAADREWCEIRLLPLFDWSNEKEAAVAWQGFLTSGRWDDGLLRAGLLDAYVATTTHVHELPEELRRQLAIHMAFIAIFAMPDPATWLRRFIGRAPEEFRIEWAQQVAYALRELDPDESLRQWDRWIKAYWVGRSQSLPIPFTPDEASATADWIIGLPGARSQAIDLALNSEASLGFNDADLLYTLDNLDIAAGAKDWTRLLTHLLKNTSEPQWAINYELGDIVSQLRNGDPALDLTELINEAMRLGITDAADW